MGVYLYSVDHPPKTHMQFMRDQVLKIWEGSPKLFRLGNDSHVLDQLRYPIMYECSPLGENRSRGQVEFVRQVRESPWIGRVVDREVALIRALGEAAVFGHITYNTHVIPMLETLQEWFDPAFYGAQAPRGNLYPYTVSEALAAALSRIRSIYPDEVERYLGLAPAHLREMVDREREVSAGANVFMGGQASLPWLFKNPEFRQAWVRALTKIASEATDMERSFQILAAETFRFKLLRTILTG